MKLIDTRPGAATVQGEGTDHIPDVGAVNGYRCDRCRKSILVVHKDKGVTPMFLACRATEDCGGRSVSFGYPPRPMPQSLRDKIQWEWVRPTNKRWKKMDLQMKDHIMRGGLELRRKAQDGVPTD